MRAWFGLDAVTIRGLVSGSLDRFAFRLRRNPVCDTCDSRAAGSLDWTSFLNDFGSLPCENACL